MGVKTVVFIIFLLLFITSSSILALEDSTYAAKYLSSAMRFSSRDKSDPVNLRGIIMAPNSVPQILSVDPPNYFPFNTPLINITITTDINAQCYYGTPAELNVTDMFIFDTTGGTTHNTLLNVPEQGFWLTYFKCKDVLSGAVSDPMEYDFETDFTVPVMILIDSPNTTITEDTLQAIAVSFSDLWLGFFEDQSCYYCIGSMGFCDNNSNWNTTQDTSLLNESGWYFNGSCSQSFNVTDYLNGQYEFGVWIADIAHNAVNISGNFTIDLPQHPLTINDYFISNTTAHDGDIISISSNYSLNLSLTNSTNITCTLYSNDESLQIMNTSESACSFNYAMSQKDYPNSSFYINAMTLEGYNISTPKMLVSLNPCGMTVRNNFTLYDDMICHNAIHDIYINELLDGDMEQMNCLGHKLSSENENNTNGIAFDAIRHPVIIKDCGVYDFMLGIDYSQVNLTIINSTFENNALSITGLSGKLNIINTNIVNTTIPLLNTSMNITAHTLIRDSDVMLNDVLITDVLEVINSNISIYNYSKNLNGNYTGLYWFRSEITDPTTQINCSNMTINILTNTSTYNLSNITSFITILGLKNINATVSTQKSYLSFEISINTPENDLPLDKINIQVTYNDSQLLLRKLDESTLKAYYYEGTNNSWIKIPVQEININQNVLQFNTTHFGLFALFANNIVPPAPVPHNNGGGGGSGGGGGGYVPLANITNATKSNASSVSNISNTTYAANATPAKIINVSHEPENDIVNISLLKLDSDKTNTPTHQNDGLTGFATFSDVQKIPAMYLVVVVVIIAAIIAAAILFARKPRKVKYKK